MMSGHTPAPWYDDGYRVHAPCDDTDKRNGRVIVEYKHGDGFNLADARLIAAAPDMQAALERLVAAINCNYDPTAIKSEGYVKAAEAALAKSRGETP